MTESRQDADAKRAEVAKYDAGRIEKVIELLSGRRVNGLVSAIEEEISAGLPPGSATAVNLRRFAPYIAEVLKAAEQDLEGLNALADPEAAAAAKAEKDNAAAIPLLPLSS